MIKSYCNGAKLRGCVSDVWCPLIVKGVMSYEYNGNPDVVTSYIFALSYIDMHNDKKN